MKLRERIERLRREVAGFSPDNYQPEADEFATDLRALLTLLDEWGKALDIAYRKDDSNTAYEALSHLDKDEHVAEKHRTWS